MNSPSNCNVPSDEQGSSSSQSSIPGPQPMSDRPRQPRIIDALPYSVNDDSIGLKNASRVISQAAGYLKKSLWGGSLFRRTDASNIYRAETPQPSAERRRNWSSDQHERVSRIEQLTQDDLIIALMGPTGAGKTSLINMATGKTDGVGHNLESCTRDIEITRCPIPDTDRAIVFVDTPGFDDTYRTDVEILQTIADWLKKTYERDIKLAGILYLHRISDNRMAGTPLKNLKVFQELCGKAALENVLLVTTMWEEVDEVVGLSRVKELRRDFWNGMIKRGSKVVRFDNTSESAWSMLEQHLLPRDIRKRRATLLQEELVNEGKRLGQSHAAKELYGAMANLVVQQEEMLQRIKEETKRSDSDGITLKVMMQEYDELRNEMTKTVMQMEELKVPLSTRVRHFFGRVRRPYILG